jgi:farnesyl diphosphate synthase
LGLDGAKKAAKELHAEALQSLHEFDHKADPLRWIADYIVQRQK